MEEDSSEEDEDLWSVAGHETSCGKIHFSVYDS